MGWAGHISNQYISGIWELGVPQGRMLRLFMALEKAHRKYRIVELVYERPGHLQGAAKKVLPAMQGVIELWCEMNKIPWTAIAPKQVKKFATGNGNADKVKMVSAAERYWPRHSFGTANDEHDAMWLLEYRLEALAHAA